MSREESASRGPGRGELDAATRARLLALARAALGAAVAGKPLPEAPRDGILGADRACFVSLHSADGGLRGCIGTLEPRGALGESVVQMAVSAGQKDPRFPPVGADELPGLSVEISVLSPHEPVSGPGDVEVGRHGLLVRGRGRSGVLLPQVASEYGWDPETFLAQTCRKAGLPATAWRDPDVRVWRFSAEVF